MSLATIRRLSDEDVRAVFESVHNNHRPPPHLQFQIVRVGPEGLKLSPPSFEFEDGLYVLLKPEKKKKSSSRDIPSQTQQQKIPSKLSDYLMKETPPSSCPWSLSGPQFPQPTAIQQRYCYPKGNPEYSSRKGGALWTMYGPDGKENLEYRLLHVYFSAKRAVNKGVSVPSEILSSSASSTPSRPTKRAKKQTPNKRSVKTPVSLRNNCQVLSHSPVLSFDMTEDPSCLSPMVMPSYNHVLRGSSDAFPPLPAKFVTPQSNATLSDRVFEQRFHPVGDQPSPFRPRVLDIASPDRSAALTSAASNVAGNRTRDSDTALMDPFPWEDNDDTMKQLEEACWDEPLFIPPPEETEEKEAEKDHIVQFAGRLESLRESFRDQILSAKDSDHAALLSMITSWARQLAQDPLRSGEAKQVTQV